MTDERTTTLRLRSVRFKDGRAPIRVFTAPGPDTEIAENFTASARRCSELGPGMVGFAIVAWTADGRVYVNYRNGDNSGIPGGGLGQYAKDIIQAEQAIRWARDE